MKLSTLISDLDITLLNPGADLDSIRVCDLTEDSRTAVPGSLFVARSGTKLDGNRYITPAIQCGCVAILTDQADLLSTFQLPARSNIAVLYTDDILLKAALIAERFYDHPAKQLLIAGVTGTNGKTTITHLAHQLIEAAGVNCGLIGTIEIDDGRERARAAMTTPPSLEMSRTLATMLEHECKAVMMEVSSHALDQQRVGALRFDAAAFTNLTGDHLDYHQTFQHYQSSKSRLFANLKSEGVAILNVDDPAHESMAAARTSGSSVLECSLNKDASFGVQLLDTSIEGMQLQLKAIDCEMTARVPIFGDYNALNILQAVLIAQTILAKSGIDPAESNKLINEELPHLKLPAGRLERVGTAQDDLTVFVDFAHTDDAISHALGAVKEVLHVGARLWCVFGCGGDRDASKRPRMGKAVSQLASEIVITSDNPRTEPPSRIINEILTGIDTARRAFTHVQSDRAQAIKFAISNAGSGDVIVIAGKGHETEQISPDGAGGVRSVHFDDREHALRALRERTLRSQAASESSSS